MKGKRMNMGRGIIGGVLGGFVGAVIWAGISCFTGYEIGWIAWGVGGLVGLGCAWGSQGSGRALGVAAVVITLLSIVAGKYAAVEFGIRKEIGSQDEVLQSALADLQKDEMVISFLADEAAAQRQAQGETIQWPDGVNPEEARLQSDYPPAIWAEAASKWEGMSTQEHEQYRDQLEEHVRTSIQAFFSNISSYGFLHSFGVMDLLFFGLAVATAFRIATRESAIETQPDTDAETQ
jgi:hypothetical protein